MSSPYIFPIIHMFLPAVALNLFPCQHILTGILAKMS